MRKIILILILTITYNLHSQDLPTEPVNGYAFPIGSKFTIKLYPKDSISFNYSIIKFEPFENIVNTWENNYLFEKEGENETIEFYFCLGTSGETEEEKDKNMKVLLLMKNRTKYSLNYNSDIQIKEEGKFEKTSNVGTHPNAKGMEMWPYMIYQIGLNDFKIMQ
ncbi:hypothetical protein QVZ41_14445 [Wenyingzhuangia sp. chi5]|uniref:Uncharacterized protein n=1 Tax=Wenyingzhuangia gilva TaxID=3057677 RepID=A0ABT8VVP0_9FLAO|nr:hypothetical protein [Wenyingzhuangia sp. chi5]MDO3696049.1 hypothetical protein [Wenyingzhuangia sp. chi5]